jgi:hypothetical protein
MHPSSSLAFLSASLVVASAALLAACSDGASSSEAGAAGSSASAGSAGASASAGSAGAGASAGSSSGGSGGAGASAGSGGAPSGGSGPGGSGGSGGSGGNDLAGMSDSFDGAALDAEWQIFNPGAVTVNVSGGSLRLTLTKMALWFQASQGVLVYKNVTGDFKVTSRVHAHRTSNPAEPPAQSVELGGLMARNAAAPPENYVFIVVGHDENDISVETKSTLNSDSKYMGPTWPSAEAELRLCRVGATFAYFKRAIGGAAWTEATPPIERADLPATLQVGPNIYSLNQPDLTVDFDEVTFAKVASLADCAKD